VTWNEAAVAYFKGLEYLRITTKIAARIDGLEPSFEPGISRVESRIVNLSTAMFGTHFEKQEISVIGCCYKTPLILLH
jgi:hypothetical protein